MHALSPTRVLIVAHQTADSMELAAAVRQRAAAGPCTFALLVPARPRGLHRVVDPEDHGVEAAEERLAAARPILSCAAGRDVDGFVGSHDPLAAVQDALNLLGFDEVMISMLPARLSRWLHLDLPRKVRALGVPVSAVTATEHDLTDVPAA
jgi:cell pole-organizing protein PopZ